MSAPASSAKSPLALTSGHVLDGRFRLSALLGKGGFGEVWQADELLPDGSAVRQVALKLLSGNRPIAEWGQEAKVLASLSHPSLVTVYSAGLLADGARSLPFVAMELLQGETLATRLKTAGPVPWRRVMAYAREVVDALDVVHGAGVVHLDLKPSNLFLAGDGHLRVLDFGIAHHGFHGAPRSSHPSGPQSSGTNDSGLEDLGTAALLDLDSAADLDASFGTHRDRASLAPIFGTPGFMAPEILEGRAPTPAADAYALGAVLYQLLSGRLPQRVTTTPNSGSRKAGVERWRAEMRAATVSGDLTPVSKAIHRLPPGIAAFIDRLLALEPASRPTGSDLGRELAEAQARPYGQGSQPYAGLSAYSHGAEGWLFGRAAEASRHAKELLERPVLVLQGASGAGKSSLAMAGIVPALAKGFAHGQDDWVGVAVRPGVNLARAVRHAREGLDGRIGLVVVVDQLEEVVTQLDEAIQERFVRELSELLGECSQSNSLRLIATVREDFTTRVLSMGSLGELLSGAIRFVPPPSVSSIREIIEAPARLFGVSIRGLDQIVDHAVQDVRSLDGALPLLSFALSEWWKTKSDGRLTLEGWREVGGVRGALDRHAEATLAALGEAFHDAARHVCLRLVSAAGTRARISEGELEAEFSAQMRTIATGFLKARLFDKDEDSGMSIAHEALLTSWQRLAVWIDDDRSDRREAQMLQRQSQAWKHESAKHKAELLLGEGQLVRALDLTRRRPELVRDAGNFITASQKRRRLARLGSNGLLLLVVGVAAAGVAFYATETKRHAEALRKREDNLRDLVSEHRARMADKRRISKELTEKNKTLGVTKSDLQTCRANTRRIEQSHRASLAARYAKHTPKGRVMSFLLQWEHAWNLHDGARMRTFFATEIEWFSHSGTGDEWVRNLEALWRKEPASRLLLGEVNVSSGGNGEFLVRITRDRRVGGMSRLSVVNLEVRQREGHLELHRAKLEKYVGKPHRLGCER